MSSSDHALAVIKAAIEAVPFVGGSIASLIGDYVPTATQRSIEAAVTDLKTRLESLGTRIDVSTVSHDEFAELFKSVYLVVVRTHHEQRRNAAVSLLTNALLRDGDPEKLTYNELDHFVRCLDFLSVGALETIARVFTLTRGQQQPDNARVAWLQFGDLLSATKMESTLLMGLVGELNAMNLLHIAGIPVGRIEEYRNYPLELTGLGYRFVSQVLVESAAV